MWVLVTLSAAVLLLAVLRLLRSRSRVDRDDGGIGEVSGEWLAAHRASNNDASQP